MGLNATDIIIYAKVLSVKVMSVIIMFNKACSAVNIVDIKKSAEKRQVLWRSRTKVKCMY